MTSRRHDTMEALGRMEVLKKQYYLSDDELEEGEIRDFSSPESPRRSERLRNHKSRDSRAHRSRARSGYDNGAHGKYYPKGNVTRGLGERPSDMIHNHKEYRPGSIISMATHESDGAEFQPGNKIQSRSEHFGNIYSKTRKYLVVAVFEDSVVALPIYTHGGTGLEYKPNKHEFASIRSIELKATATLAENEYGNLWAETYGGFATENSWKATVSGELTPESTEKLLKLYNDTMTGKLKKESRLETTREVRQPPQPKARERHRKVTLHSFDDQRNEKQCKTVGHGKIRWCRQDQERADASHQQNQEHHELARVSRLEILPFPS
ncbi:hypothetical protein G7Y89_g3191 [Cudoniella acicularis]|uniref:DUF6590 domain-containing protein n=1 Tax=Cudoniella acicularis TaxID=354080 RepID=A0A8H4RRV1_9HELO|nr:hypothetical protein G7Y89_g3191 [Cudoniella acicularis]